MGLVRKKLLQGKNDLKEGGICFGFSPAAKIKNCLSINKLGVTEEKNTFKSSSDVNKCLDRKDIFNMLYGQDLLSKQPLSCKKFLEMGAIAPNKERNCGDCKANLICVICDELIYQTEIFTAKLNGFKKLQPNAKGHTLLWCKDNFE